MKSRGVYQTVGTYQSHKQLEELVLDRATMETRGYRTRYHR